MLTLRRSITYRQLPYPAADGNNLAMATQRTGGEIAIILVRKESGVSIKSRRHYPSAL